MLLSTAQKIKELASEGPTIVGDKPLDSLSLMDEESDVQELFEIAYELWGEGISGFKLFGKGMFYWGIPLEEVLNRQNTAPDDIVPKGLPISWIYRKTTDADIYFVSSTSSNELDVALSFRLTGAYLEDWEITEITINEDWSLTFKKGWGAPMQYNLSKTSLLTEISNEAFSHFSGTVVYKKDIMRPEKGKRFILELGEVHNIAELWYNDKKVATHWAPPYNFDLTSFLEKGKNRVEVKVTNT